MRPGFPGWSAETSPSLPNTGMHLTHGGPHESARHAYIVNSMYSAGYDRAAPQGRSPCCTLRLASRIATVSQVHTPIVEIRHQVFGPEPLLFHPKPDGRNRVRRVNRMVNVFVVCNEGRQHLQLGQVHEHSCEHRIERLAARGRGVGGVPWRSCGRRRACPATAARRSRAATLSQGSGAAATTQPTPVQRLPAGATGANARGSGLNIRFR